MAQPTRAPPSQRSHIQKMIILGGLGMLTGWLSHICCSFLFSSLCSQAPPLPVLPLCTKHFGFKVLKLCELDYWNGTVLNVAHGMIPVAWNSCKYVVILAVITLTATIQVCLDGPK
jgi:hypothetical protein